MKHLEPYKGTESYIFISYSHKDKDEVLNVLEQMVETGYRVWFDEGIDPGTEWDENIARHVEQCDAFIAFISENYIISDNCKDELNYARDLKKDRLLVYLEKTDLPSGMAMRLNRLQAIHKYTYKDKKDFFQKLFSAPMVERNKGIPQVFSEISNSIDDMHFEDYRFSDLTEIENCVDDLVGNGFIIENGVLTEYTGNDKNVVVPKSVTKIGESAFSCCENLQSVVIPESVTEIGEDAFSWCGNLQSVVIPEGVTKIGKRAFSWCGNLQSVVIPESVTEIGEDAFFSCKNLQSIVIPEGVTEIGKDAFSWCRNLQSIAIPESVVSIHCSAFEDCEKLTIHAPTGSYAETYAKANGIPFVAE